MLTRAIQETMFVKRLLSLIKGICFEEETFVLFDVDNSGLV